ncbi:unnamed protein product [Mytilus edulis]|uniref:Integrase catalytic domain-containing protein n=1 Tax=Mytilus edulis TaxID=6550 RepID=A0A8S3QXT6_MYTED|nr:unnamed protein product [Mytilus edulis]
MKTDIEYFENVKTTDCIDDLNTVKDGHASCLNIQSVINDTETDGDTDSVRGCLSTNLAIRSVNVNTEELSFDITSNWISYWSNSQLREMQENDQNITNLLQSDEKPKTSDNQNKSKETKIIIHGLWQSLTIQNNHFEREIHGLVYQFVALEQIRNFIFEQLHCTKYSAHFGRDKTLDLIKKNQGREFESGLFAALCDKLEIDKTRTCPYRSQSDGMVERFNQTLQSILRLFVNEHRNDWDDHILFINMAYRDTQHASTNCSPNLLMFGHELICPIDVMFGLPQGYKSIPCPIAYVGWVQEALTNAFQLAHTQSGLSANRQK